MSAGVDCGFGSSSTAVVLTEFLKEEHKIRVLCTEEFEHANPQDIVDLCFDLYRKHWNTWFFVDGANRATVNLMKVAWGAPQLILLTVNVMTVPCHLGSGS